MPAYPMTDEPIALPTGGVRTLIRDLGGDENPGHPPAPYTGALHIQRPQGAHAAIWIHGGIIYAAHLDGYEPPIALRLRTARFLNDAQFRELLEFDSGDAGPEAVDRSWVPAYVVEELHREIMLSTLSHLYDWMDASWWWDEDATTNLYVTSGLPLMLASAAVDERIGQWKAVTRAYPHVVKPKSVPYPGPAWNNRGITIVTPEMETMLSCIDGTRNIAQIASQCGLTRFEIAKIMSQTVAVGIITFSAGDAIAAAPPPVAGQQHATPAAFPQPNAQALASAPPPAARGEQPMAFPPPPPPPPPLPPTPPGPNADFEAIVYSSPDSELVEREVIKAPASTKKEPKTNVPDASVPAVQPLAEEVVVDEVVVDDVVVDDVVIDDVVVDEAAEIDDAEVTPSGDDLAPEEGGAEEDAAAASDAAASAPTDKAEIRALTDELDAILSRVGAIRDRLGEIEKS